MLISSAEAMIELGRRFARELRAGDLVILSGEMGAGKTTFVRGIGEFFGVETSSPTFVISRVHETVPKLIHSDLYRLLDSGDLSQKLVELDLDFGPSAIHLIEWGEVILGEVGRDFLTVNFKMGSSEEERIVEFVGTGARWERFQL